MHPKFGTLVRRILLKECFFNFAKNFLASKGGHKMISYMANLAEPLFFNQEILYRLKVLV